MVQVLKNNYNWLLPHVLSISAGFLKAIIVLHACFPIKIKFGGKFILNKNILDSKCKL